mmetsp:Transcript_19985/g.48954  ORF Transcript_19985/g.48954 Transcript_19985/m.48954 type:complete len:324 (+) Transcript_19985:381-1352(+)|eukprot:CAMPEP_0114515760 /NCGR_PEP_ID=MMETSP0109-20121206/16935_1 /TAXON_ID=29199 /ORGANISM="Chlorarachnion reptans, Strain CCCM449" /LENGTH=323 /DNA_ID=CAMNT_0001696041 /DNA_START=321 /DNA_END=1292 /DNA_ORIENTATION=+
MLLAFNLFLTVSGSWDVDRHEGQRAHQTSLSAVDVANSSLSLPVVTKEDDEAAHESTISSTTSDSEILRASSDRIHIGESNSNACVSAANTTSLHFIHIPKNAGTTVEALGLKYGMPWGRYDLSGSVHYPIDAGSCISFYHRPPVGRNTNVRTFCIHRDPMDRILSEAKYEIVWLKPNKKGVIAAYPQTQPPCPSSKQFNENIRKYMHEGNQVDCHWVPQFKFLQHCDHILRFESLEKDFNGLMKHYGLLPRWDKTHKMDVDHILKAKECQLGHDDLDELTLYKARIMYKVDFDVHYALKDDVVLNGVSNPEFRRFLDDVTRV